METQTVDLPNASDMMSNPRWYQMTCAANVVVDGAAYETCRVAWNNLCAGSSSDDLNRLHSAGFTMIVHPTAGVVGPAFYAYRELDQANVRVDGSVGGDQVLDACATSQVTAGEHHDFGFGSFTSVVTAAIRTAGDAIFEQWSELDSQVSEAMRPPASVAEAMRIKISDEIVTTSRLQDQLDAFVSGLSPAEFAALKQRISVFRASSEGTRSDR